MKDLFRGYLMGMILAALTVIGCATAFPWRYYATQMPETCYDAGKLLGKDGSDGWPDTDLNECKPDKTSRLKCITMLVDDFYSLKADDEKCHNDLKFCQKGAKP